MRTGPLLTLTLLALLTVSSGTAQAVMPPPPLRVLMVGAAEDAARSGGPSVADAKMALAQLAGFDTVRVTSIWSPGETELPPTELDALRSVTAAAAVHGIRVIVSVYPFGSRTTPLTAAARAEFASYAASLPRLVPQIRHVIIGNEPNLNRFWMPQFVNGVDAAAPAYLSLLAEAYDAIKAVSKDVTVIGGALAPRGGDDPKAIRPTHSPTRFILDLGAAYRRSGRKAPVMDWLAFHPYLEKSKLPPSFAHPKTTTIAIADYGKLTALLGRAFDGTAQSGSTLPILYDEFGVQSAAPAEKRSLYSNPGAASASDAVDEATQGRYYRQALQLAVCQPNVVGLLIFHVSDEEGLDRWQSGVYYVDDTPKTSLPVVRTAAGAARAGSLVETCPG